MPFASPYTLAPGTEAAHVCAVTDLPGCPLGGLAWSTTLAKWVGTMDCSLQGGAQFFRGQHPVFLIPQRDVEAGAGRVQPDADGGAQQHLGVARVVPLAVVGLQQRVLE